MNGKDERYVLLVESNLDKVSLIRKMLAEASDFIFKVETATTLDRAIGMLAGNHYDAVLLEMFLPDSSGLNPVRQIASRFQGTAIIVMSCCGLNQLHRQALRYGAHGYLDIESISPRYLANTIDYALERRHSKSRQERLLSDLNAALEEIEALRDMSHPCAGSSKAHD